MQNVINEVGARKLDVLFCKDEHKKSASQFICERFQYFAPSHNLSIICGSSFLDKKVIEPTIHCVCDAASVRQCKTPNDDSLLNISLSFAVADGLGYDTEDQIFNDSLGEVAGKACEYYVKKVAMFDEEIDCKHFLKDIGIESEKHKLYSNLYRSYCDSKNSLAGGNIIYNKDQYQAQLVNIGDTMIWVIDGSSYQIKEIIPAKVHHRFRSNYSPQSIQELSGSFDRVDLEFSKINLNEGDFVVAMTDGVYSCFEKDMEVTESEKLDLKGNLPDHRRISFQDHFCNYSFADLIRGDLNNNNNDNNNIIENINNQNYLSAYELGKIILSKGIELFLQDKNSTDKLMEDLNNLIDSQPEKSELLAMTLEKFLLYTIDKDEEFHKRLDNYLNDCGKQDGVSFYLDKAIVKDLIYVLSRQNFGDCSTISVVRMPYFIDEVLKTFILDNYNLTPQVVNIIKEKIKDDDELDRIINRLKNEAVSFPELNKNYSLKDENLHYLFSENQIEVLRETIKSIMHSIPISFKTKCKHFYYSLRTKTFGEPVNQLK